MSPPTAATEVRGEKALRREIGLLVGVALVINATIGTGIFKTPAKVARLAGSGGAALWVWAAGAVIALAGAVTLAELAAALPRAGGLYEYLRRAWGRPVAFLFGWAKLTLLIPSAVGSFAKLAAEALAALLALPPDPRRDALVAVAFIALATGVNLLGIRSSSLQQALLTTVKYGGVALLALLGLAVAGPFAAVAPPAVPLPIMTTPTATGIFAALVAVMWAYDGWADLSSLAGEVKDPGRTLPRALLAGTAAVAVVYLLANLAYLRVLGLEGLRRSTTGSAMAALHLAVLTLGDGGGRLLAALVLVSCTGGCMSSLLTGSRVFVPLASDGLFWRRLGAVSSRHGVPIYAVLLAGLLGAGYVLWRSFEQLTEAFVVGYFPFYVLAVLAVFRLRRREPTLPRPFRVPLYPLPPLLFLVGATALLLGAAADVDRAAVLAFAVLGLGLPVGWIWSRRRTRAGG